MKADVFDTKLPDKRLEESAVRLGGKLKRKAVGEAPQVRHLAALLNQAQRHKLKTYNEADSITVRPGSTEFAEYGTAASAEAAGANDEELFPPEPPTPAPEDQAPAEDDPAGGDGPVLGDPGV